MSNYQNAGDGLKKMYIAAIGVLVCGVLANIPLVGILFAIGVLIFCVVDLMGYYSAGKDIAGCRAAFVLRIISVVITLAGNFMTLPDSMELPYAIIDELLPVVIVCLVFLSVSRVLRENGAEDIAKQGIRAMWIYVGCHIVTTVGDIWATAMLLGGEVTQALLTAVIMIAVSVAALVFQLKFFRSSAEQFGSYI